MRIIQLENSEFSRINKGRIVDKQGSDNNNNAISVSKKWRFHSIIVTCGSCSLSSSCVTLDSVFFGGPSNS